MLDAPCNPLEDQHEHNLYILCYIQHMLLNDAAEAAHDTLYFYPGKLYHQCNEALWYACFLVGITVDHETSRTEMLDRLRNHVFTAKQRSVLALWLTVG